MSKKLIMIIAVATIILGVVSGFAYSYYQDHKNRDSVQAELKNDQKEGVAKEVESSKIQNFEDCERWGGLTEGFVCKLGSKIFYNYMDDKELLSAITQELISSKEKDINMDLYDDVLFTHLTKEGEWIEGGVELRKDVEGYSDNGMPYGGRVDIYSFLARYASDGSFKISFQYSSEYDKMLVYAPNEVVSEEAKPYKVSKLKIYEDLIKERDKLYEECKNDGGEIDYDKCVVEGGDNLLTYTNPDYPDFSFQYPSDWELSEGRESGERFEIKVSNKYGALFININNPIIGIGFEPVYVLEDDLYANDENNFWFESAENSYYHVFSNFVHMKGSEGHKNIFCDGPCADDIIVISAGEPTKIKSKTNSGGVSWITFGLEVLNEKNINIREFDNVIDSINLKVK